MLKKVVMLTLGCLLLLGCKQEVLEPEQMIQGKFALDDGSGLTREYLNFENGHLTYFVADPYPFVEGKIWDANSNSFIVFDSGSYHIREGYLRTSVGSLSGPVELKDGVLTIGGRKYSALTGFDSHPYSSITADPEVTYNYSEQDFSIPFTIERPIPAGKASVSTNNSQWITNLKVQDGTITGHISATSTDRNGLIKLSYTHATDVWVTVKQAPTTFIKASPESFTVEYTASTQTIGYTIENPLATSTLTATSTAYWITDIQVSGTQISFKVSENNIGADRNGALTLSYAGAPDVTITVTQKWSASSISLTPSSQTADYTGGSFNFSYAITNPRADATTSATSQNNWITNVELSGTSISYKVAENNSGSARTGKIRLTYGGYATAEFTVTQEWSASSIVLTPTSHNMNNVGGSFDFNYSITNPRASVTLTATSKNNWITDVVVSGNTVSYKVTENTSGNNRTGKISLTYGTYATAEFTVIQAWSTSVIVLATMAVECDYTGGSRSFTYEIQSPQQGTTVTAQSQVSWITGVSVSGTKVNYTVAENNSGSQRTGIIKMTYGSFATAEFTVTQKWAAAAISLPSSSQTISYSGGSYNFGYSITNPRSGVSLTASSQNDWITNVSVTGTTVYYKVASLNSYYQRKGTITLTYGTYATQKFSVTQTGAPVTSLYLNKGTLGLQIGESEKLIATVTPSDAPISWSSGNRSVATVDQTGNVTAVGNGTAIITVRTDNSLTATCTVTVSTAVANISLNKTSLALAPEVSETLIATITPSSASNQSITWSSNNTSVATVDYNGKVSAIAKGTATITAKTVDGNKTATCTVTVLFNIVDLGLSVKWADCNLGASSPEGQGDYYAWGEIETKRDYSWSTYKWGASAPFSKYSPDYPVLEPEDDTAHSHLGGNWYMPTNTEYQELIDNCSKLWTTYNGRYGYRFTSNVDGYKSKWIFLPVVGSINGTSVEGAETQGYYWSACLNPSTTVRAWGLFFDKSEVAVYSGGRLYGRVTRPVLRK